VNSRISLGSGTLTLADDLVVSNSGGSTVSASVSISSDIGGSGNLTLYNVANSTTVAPITLTGNSTFTGNISIQKGAVTFSYSSGSSLGNVADAITLGSAGNGSATLISTASATTLRNNVTVASGSGGTLLLGSSSGAASDTIFGGTLTLNDNLTITSSKASGAFVRFTNVVSGVGGLTKIGTGAVRLNGANTYTGATVINEGTLIVNGTHSAGAGAYTVNSGGTLSGTGTISRAVSVNAGGTLAPGNSPGILHIGDLSMANDSTNIFELNGTTVGTQYDQLDVTGTVDLDNNAVLVLSVGYSAAMGDMFTIVNNDGTDPVSGLYKEPSGNVLSQGEEFAPSGTPGFKINYLGGTGNDIVLTVVPEPSVITLLGLGGLAWLWRRRRNQ
jgi:autotransporter-associated beta strand protein